MEKETARKAARWWADFLRNGAPMDNGDKSNEGGMTMMLALLLQSQIQKGHTPQSIDRFEDLLVSRIMKENTRYIGVDYHADPTLSECAKEAGIVVDGALPWKTSMWINGDKITVRCGYGAGIVEL